MSASREKHEWVAQAKYKHYGWYELSGYWGRTAVKRYIKVCKAIDAHEFGWTSARLIHRVTVEHVVEQMRAKRGKR